MSISSFWSKSSSFFMKSQAVIDEMKRQTAIDDQEIQKLRSQVSQQMIITYFMTIHNLYAISYLARVVSISAFFYLVQVTSQRSLLLHIQLFSFLL